MVNKDPIWHVYSFTSGLLVTEAPERYKLNPTYLAWLACMGLGDTLEILGSGIRKRAIV